MSSDVLELTAVVPARLIIAEGTAEIAVVKGDIMAVADGFTRTGSLSGDVLELGISDRSSTISFGEMHLQGQ